MFTFFLDRVIELTIEEPFDSRCATIYPATMNQLWHNVYLKVSIYSLPFISSSRSLDHSNIKAQKKSFSGVPKQTAS
jgi:hypothetical protein